jgi:hypothetical protein
MYLSGSLTTKVSSPLLSSLLVDAHASLSSIGTPIAPVFLTPTFIFSRALPRPGAVALLSSNVDQVSPQLFVADVGFSPKIWDRIGVDDFETGLWGAEGIVRVSFDGRS